MKNNCKLKIENCKFRAEENTSRFQSSGFETKIRSIIESGRDVEVRGTKDGGMKIFAVTRKVEDEIK